MYLFDDAIIILRLYEKFQLSNAIFRLNIRRLRGTYRENSDSQNQSFLPATRGSHSFILAMMVAYLKDSSVHISAPIMFLYALDPFSFCQIASTLKVSPIRPTQTIDYRSRFTIWLRCCSLLSMITRLGSASVVGEMTRSQLRWLQRVQLVGIWCTRWYQAYIFPPEFFLQKISSCITLGVKYRDCQANANFWCYQLGMVMDL